MKKNKLISGLAGTVMILSLMQAAPLAAFAEEGERTFTESKLKAHGSDKDLSFELDCRFYDDMPSVPYIKLNEYYKALTDTALTVTVNGSEFTFEDSNGVKTSINTDTDKLSSENLDSFFAMQNDSGKDKNYFIRLESWKYDDTPAAAEVDFSKYGIDLTADEEDVWFPAATLADSILGDDFNAALIGGELYFFSDKPNGFDRRSLTQEKTDFDKLLSEPRPADLVLFSYNELCYTIDRFYGFPGRIPLNDVLAEKGLDGMLETNDDTRKVKSYLLSESFADYCIGLTGLQRYMFDGGHTAFSPNDCFDPVNEKVEKLLEDSEITSVELEDSVNYFAEGFKDVIRSGSINDARIAALGKGPDEDTPYTYVKKGDTAVFSFVNFYCEFLKWMDYYENGGEKPDDLISGFHDSIVDAENDPDIKNFLVDVSSNTGGEEAVVLYMASMITGRDSVVQFHNLADVSVTSKILTDKNLDGKIDEKDDDVKFSLNFGILCSGSSFSCGNYLPSLMKDSGMLVLGEKSGGGSCVVRAHNTAEGLPFYISSVIRLHNDSGVNIDTGIEPHAVLFTENEEGGNDYSGFFDIEKISAEFKKFYGVDDSEPEESLPSSETDTSGESETDSQNEDSSSSLDTSSAPESKTDKQDKGSLPNTGAAVYAAAAVCVIAALILAVRRKRS